jgi:dihydrofolate synthase / folylpolyglutamate synthase
MSDKGSMPSEAIETYCDALRAIWLRSAYDRGFISNPFWGDEAADLGLRRTEALLEMLGRPQDRYPIIHVAGSKGKGSTCAFASAILVAGGFRTGLYTSPHLHAFRERIAINGEAISEGWFAHLTRDVLGAAEQLERSRPDLGEVTAFELVTAMAFTQFANELCDVAVIEVGMGGKLDATNVVDPAVSVITTLDYEHTKVLGSNLAEIAAQKAGIIKPGRPVVSLAQVPEALRVIEDVAATNGCRLYLEGRDWVASGTSRQFSMDFPEFDFIFNLKHLSLPGSHQVRNAAAAVGAIWLLREHDLPFKTSAVAKGLASAKWPGRYEVVNEHGQPTYILDGAHTPSSARALVDAVLSEERNESQTVILGMMADKDSTAFARKLAALNAPVIVTASKSPRAASISDVLAGVEAAGLQATPASDVRSALTAASQVAGVQGTVIVTGSLATVAEAREALGLAVPDPLVDDEAFARSNLAGDSNEQ